MTTERQELLAELAREEARLAEIERQHEAARSRMAALRVELATLASDEPTQIALPVAAGLPTPATPTEKVRLFRALFRGREEVFPTRFVSKKTGKAGYAPACANKFVRGVCDLPRVKCSECPNQAFTPVDDRVVLDHLQGRHVMGVYPLLEDETCWFLAIDFDKSSWEDDVGAFAETCRAMDVPVAVERSRSGNGAHGWFFFGAPVAASLARKMGCSLLTETMSRRHQLSMGSYDRLFPNQDTMPRGGFGNLIALPLQYEPRQQGNTVFVDASFQAYDDQWSYLASLPRIAPSLVESLAAEATRRGLVIGVRLAEPADGEEATPWRRRPSGRSRQVPILGPLPREVRAVLAQRLFVEKAGLPSPLLNEIKRLAAFQNPEFYKKQSLRLSTAMTPRVIACAEELAQHIALPRGCLGDSEELFQAHGVALQVEDQRQEGEALQVELKGELTAVQQGSGMCGGRRWLAGRRGFGSGRWSMTRRLFGIFRRGSEVHPRPAGPRPLAPSPIAPAGRERENWLPGGEEGTDTDGHGRKKGRQGQQGRQGRAAARGWLGWAEVVREGLLRDNAAWLFA